jgi:hypothetical protein
MGDDVMQEENKVNENTKTPAIEIHVGRSYSAAASAVSDSKLSPEQIEALQTTIASLISGFRPPDPPATEDKFGLDSLEIEIGFKVETSSGTALKLLLDAKGEANIRAKVVWSRHTSIPNP